MKKIVIGEKIVKSFGEGKEKTKVLDGVSVEIGAGEFVAVMGPSGSGKTTLMFCLSGMETINSGKVLFDGKDLTSFREDELADLRRRRMGFVFQQPTLLKNLNLLDNIILPAQKGNEKRASALTEKAKKLMEKMGLKGLEQRNITQVSGGQLQRAGICRALMSDPEIIYGDEPTGALNSRTAQEIMNILRDINNEGTALLLVTHDTKVAAQAQRVLFMRDGNIVKEQTLPGFDNSNLESRMNLITEEIRKTET